jgi:hypothetical protein
VNGRRIFAAIAISLAAASAHAECTSSGVATKLKLPFIAAHAPCGYKGREADVTTSYGPACSTAATGLKSCYETVEVCASNSDCAPKACTDPMPGYSTEEPCDSAADCGYCDAYGNQCFDTSSSCFPFGNSCVNADSAYDTGYRFGETGTCSFSAKSKVQSNCAAVTDRFGNRLGLPEGPCHVTYMSVQCKGLERQDGNPINGPTDGGFRLHMLARVTLDNGSTVVDLPFFMSFLAPEGGSLTLATSTAEQLNYMFGPAEAALPPCTTIEIVSAEIMDPDGVVFARAGLATR